MTVTVAAESHRWKRWPPRRRGAQQYVAELQSKRRPVETEQAQAEEKIGRPFQGFKKTTNSCVTRSPRGPGPARRW